MTNEAVMEAAVMVVYDDKNKLALLEERTRPDRVYFGEKIFLSGLVEDDERDDASVAAARELREELGIRAVRLSPLTTEDPIIGELGQRLHPFMVTDWEGDVPDEVIGSGNPVRWEALEKAATSSLPSISRIAQLAIEYLVQEDRLIEQTLNEIAGLDLRGTALIDEPVGFHRPWGSQTAYVEVGYGEIAARGSGWKFHLNFDAENSDKVRMVNDTLERLQQLGCITAFKIGKGGGKAWGQPGKEATVYIGHRDKADTVAPLIEGLLVDVLDEPEGKALKDDISFTDHVVGRFELVNVDREFSHYGAQGYPILELDRYDLEDMRNGARNASDEEIDRYMTEARIRADAILRQRYGVFYTGSKASGSTS